MCAHHRFVFLVDLHLSDQANTANTHALQWALEETNQLAPDFLAIGGDITSYGTAAATTYFLEALAQIQVPFFFTPGNAELRRPDALPLLHDLLPPQRRWTVQDDLLVLFPDTATGTLPAAERTWMQQVVAEQDAVERRIVLTHYPLETLAQGSSEWLEQWSARHRIELLVAGHQHFQHQRPIGSCLEVVAAALDPHKAFGDLPGITLFESDTPGQWHHRFIPWSPTIQLLPASLPAAISPVGWSIQGDPIAAAQETLDFGLSCLEIRPKDLDFSRAELDAVLQQLRHRNHLYLSYHLPSLKWDPDTNRISGADTISDHVDCALQAGANSLTVHVPQLSATAMLTGAAQPSALHQEYVDIYARLFRQPAAAGVRIAIENVHNPLDTPLESPGFLFATCIEQYLGWLETMDQVMADIPNATIGTLFDVGHARNNGGELDNLQPLCEWYARLGQRILGYHIHQVDINPDSGRLANHREITGLFTKRISYAGFLWAWSTHQINRAPLFIEVRDATARRNTAVLFKSLFDNAEQFTQAAQLPGRQSLA